MKNYRNAKVNVSSPRFPKNLPFNTYIPTMITVYSNMRFAGQNEPCKFRGHGDAMKPSQKRVHQDWAVK